ncbi:ABC transporter ATP-binding protein [Oricola thermophila]|uniref:ABC transporter ATP-binding protein n=1 Tax=Oricola thermophila TaxID=2742145 RepID=A0A6N1VBN5_9HYPH|nr:ABC transporter ATP-binding protein [Oricola thermophila]QKV18300.1 ABC transporter ATP-binding protein [Oricola thermophila]
MKPVLDIEGLRIEIGAPGGAVRAVDELSYSVGEGETLVIVGESGSGKSVGLLSAMRLLSDPPFRVTGGSVRFNGRDVLSMPLREWRRLAGEEIGMVFQDALTSLNPVFTVGWQIAERLRMQGVARGAATDRAIKLMQDVGIPDAAKRYRAFPHQFSGGMRQRIMIAIALASGPSLLVCDEPTTALDVTIQAQILELLNRHQRESGAAMIMVTHDLAVASEIADRIAVVYAGRVVEVGDMEDVLFRPLHPYTSALLAASPTEEEGRLPQAIPGTAPNLTGLGEGCAFAPRCSRASELCGRVSPPRVENGTHAALCHHALEVPA